ncbi:hypothetical protein J2T12_001595 [Paenibacillus anaericanus]|uniref:Z-ring formation inhibitor MciZ n=1 Tax=Paenibacillus anaericanus TaxID=170367 RepID=A0A3S1BUF8_9BACL|nr:Z-ring formation inhibitor MciZ [Paenibacillus anaericanus]MDQ0088189.1 hypothetical protein [Paenibacillus anaericanus]RUT47733.1 Z-ring formation inhibitor MciZ [Paenibacillus anaericanus]
MKSYFSNDRLRAQGKAWQIRILLSQWQKEAGPSVKVKELLASRLTK